MNKSRRMVMLAANALAQSGYAVLQLDLFGCGDSSGELAEARWSDWIDDVLHAASWLRERHPGPLWLWGERAGCLLATAAATRIAGERHLLFWQAQSNGKLVLQQFLRLKMASQIQHGTSKGVTEALQRELSAGRAVEVAGYRLGPDIARGLESSSLHPPPGLTPCRLLWLELSSRDPPSLLPASEAVLELWRAAGHRGRGQVGRRPGLLANARHRRRPRAARGYRYRLALAP